MALQSCRHPIREKFHRQDYVPNDVYATNQTRFQIITGCNMSGKSTYIRSIALVCIMTQVGSFVPASYASLPIIHQIFARTSNEDSIEDNASTFAMEMREMAAILHAIDDRSLAIVDELGRGTSTRDGLAIAIAISEALIDSKAFVWFATHFHDLVKILEGRPGVTSLHMSVTISPDASAMNMNYRVAEGVVTNDHYGLVFARVLPFPPDVLSKADEVSKLLEERLRSGKSRSSIVVTQRKRKLILTLKEHLHQSGEGSLEGEALRSWLLQLQELFVSRMIAEEGI
jgi:DNA mismatch repair protein MSH4